ncbi:MAG: type II secretion system F family protein [Candidatus Micrarchaeota archaeon]|nr:type II secretion system F family protein [Candidatus Micrarchaeota archaeon]
MMVLSGQQERELQRDLECSGLPIKWGANRYALNSLLAAVAVGLAALAATVLWGWQFAHSLALALLALALTYSFLLRLPGLLAMQRATQVDADLPILLRALATELSIGVPFEDALESASRMEGPSSAIFRGVLADLRRGVPPADAFANARRQTRSRMMDKALSHIAFLHSYGYEASGLGKLVDEITAEHRSRVKGHASTSSLLGVVLIAVSAVVPALATTYLVVGSSFMDLRLSTTDIYMLYIVVLPLLTLTLLLVMRALSPIESRRGADFLSKEELRKFTVFLSTYGVDMEAGTFLAYVSLASLVLAGIAYALTSSLLSLAVALLPLVFYGIFLYLDDIRVSQAEERMPDALLYAASLHHLGLEKVIGKVASADYGVLSAEFGRAHRQVQAGLSVRQALLSLSERNPSPIIERGISLLIKIQEVGAPLERALKSTAEDIQDLFMLFRERSAVLSMQKYNMMVAALLVPAIFGVVLSLVASLDLTYIESLLSSPSSRALLPAIQSAVPLYLIEFSLLSSIFIADYSGSWKRFAVYLVFLLPLTFGIYYGALAFI